MEHMSRVAIALSISSVLFFSLVGARSWWKDIQFDSLAQDTCAELEGAVILQAGPIIHKAVSRAEGMGYTGIDLGSKMKRHCPSITNALDDRSRDAPQPPGHSLAGKVSALN